MLKKIYDYKVGDKVVTPTGAIATVVKETYKGERLILKYDEVPEWQGEEATKSLRHADSVTLAKEHVKPIKQDLYTTCKVVVR
jgi:hypothetical protein|tara:strand:- start:270 stop:518 length:249 start_codon:yes stop_codon:yes gene_type:complete